jgi:class 3 adenylate cyclase
VDEGKRSEEREDELRPVTALFADLVGSTALGERLAADELKALVGECVTMMSRAVEEYGGVVQAYQGDGICAYFGVPVSHEDDPERAARAGLRIIELIGEYGRDIAEAWDVGSFNVRVGINTGRVGVGLVGAGDPQAVALGDATNVAARLESLAQPGSIVVGEVTARRLTERFVFEDLGPTKVKGRTDPVAAFRLVAPKTRDAVTQRTPMIGRDTERSALESALDALVAGRGQVLLVTGDPGIGKTRLLEEMRSLAGERVTWLEGRCLSYGGLPSWPFVDILMSQLGIELGEPEIAMRTKARAKLSPDVLPSLARLLRIRLDIAPTREASLPPDEFRDELHSSYGRWIAGLAARKPVVLALEDAQWADVTTRQLADALLELTDRAPLLIVATMEIDPSSEGAALRLRALDQYAHRATELRLTPLSDEAAAELLRTLMPIDLDARTRSRLLAEAEGNPLYLEELLQGLLESGGVERRRRTWTITIRAAAGLLPPALENLLVSRIDRLPEGPRRVAQAAAAIGREFPVRVLEHVVAKDVSEDLTRLLRAEIVREVRRYPEFVCTFKHRLMQEAALSTLTAARRRELYARIAHAFEELYADAPDDHLERLAHYHAQAENTDAARDYLARAAEKAAEAGAVERAENLRKRAIAVS